MNKRKQRLGEVPMLVLTIPQVADALGIGRTKVYELIRRQGLPTVTIGNVKRVSMASLHRWIEQHEIESFTHQ